MIRHGSRARTGTAWPYGPFRNGPMTSCAPRCGAARCIAPRSPGSGAISRSRSPTSTAPELQARRGPLARYDRIVPQSSLAPAFLLSMPQLTDPNFSRTVVLLCKHNHEGAFGLVLNRPLVTAGRVVVSLDPPVATDRELQVWVGGPVEPQSSWMLVGDDLEPAEGLGGKRIADGLCLSASPDLLRRLLEPDPPPRTRLIVGYSGW